MFLFRLPGNLLHMQKLLISSRDWAAVVEYIHHAAMLLFMQKIWKSFILWLLQVDLLIS